MFSKEILENQDRIFEVALKQRPLDTQEIVQMWKLEKIVALLGPRRAGKTFLGFQILRDLVIQKQIEKEDILYFDFSSLLEKNVNLDSLLSEYFVLFPDRKPVCFFDEIQELEDFPEKLIGLKNRGYRIIVTGSSAHLLSRELSTILRGKVYTKEIFPLDFPEFLSFRDVTYSPNDLIKNTGKYKNLFLEYLAWGGFPEVVLTQDEYLKKSIVKTYLDVMLYRDLIDRYAIKNEYSLRFFLQRIMSADTKEVNISRIFNDLKSQNIKLGKDLLYEFSTYLQDTYFTMSLTNFFAPVKGTKKSYLTDRSYLCLIQKGDDMGQRLENAVFWHLRKHFGDIFFLRGEGGEVDFFIPSASLSVQVTKELSYENEAREMMPLSRQEGEKVCILMDRNNPEIERKYPQVRFVSVLDLLLNPSVLSRERQDNTPLSKNS